MTQDQANQLYNNYRQVVEQQKKAEIELAKSECNLRQEQYLEQLKQEMHQKDQADLAQKIKDAESYRDNKIQEIEKNTNDRLTGAEQRLKEHVEEVKQIDIKQQEDKLKQDQDLRQKDLSNDKNQVQRDELDKRQEQAKQDLLHTQAQAENSVRDNLQRDLIAKQNEIDKRQQQLERQRELEQQKALEDRNRSR